MNLECAAAEYETAWRRKLAGPTRRYWLDLLMRMDGLYLPDWKREVVLRLKREWLHKRPMERANGDE